jgi:hypothetical protein
MLQTVMTPAAMFGDDYGVIPYYTFGYNSTGGYSVPPALNMGQGYWLGSNSAQVIDAVGTPVSTASLLLGNGFNIIGNPFAAALLKADLRFYNGIDTKDIVQAASASWLSNVLYTYDGSGYITEGTALGVWKGYWIPMMQPGITIQYQPTVVVPTPQASPVVVESTPTDWAIDLTAKYLVAEIEYTDRVASFGVRADATEGFDPLYDAPRPPKSPALDYIEVSFPVSGREYPAAFGQSLARDYKTSEKTEWEFFVNTSHEGNVTLSWDNNAVSKLSDEVKIILYDQVARRSIDMKKVNSYTFEQSGMSRRFTINNAENVVPKTFELSQNYPNPFNPTTTIQYGLPFDANVIIEIYNNIGQRIATPFIGAAEAGYHEVKFDAALCASGLYYYRIVATAIDGTTVTESKKMILVK